MTCRKRPTTPRSRAGLTRRGRAAFVARRSEVDGDDHVRGLDHRDDLAALGEAEVLNGLNGDRGHQAIAASVQFYVRDGFPHVDPGDPGGYLVTRAQRHFCLS